MDYKWLYKIRYSDRDNYENEYKSRINSTSSYKYEFKVSGFPAFVLITPELLQLIYDIRSYDKALYKKRSSLPDVALESYMRSCLIDEVKQTNDLEGVASTRKEINDILTKSDTTNTRLIGIVNKYSLLMRNNDIPLSKCSDIRALYNDLVLEEIKQSNPENLPDGEIFRSGRVYVKDRNSGQTIHEGVFPETLITETMSSVLNIIGDPSYNALINIAVIHYMFGYIHPFYDGNGRTSRFISSYLISKELERLTSLRLSYAIKKDSSAYYRMFKLANDPINRGELTGFVIYLLELLKDTLVSLTDALTDYISLLDYCNNIIAGLDYNDFYKELLSVIMQNTLFGYCGLSIQELCEETKKSDTTVRNALKTLDSAGLIRSDKGRAYRYRINVEKLEKLDKFTENA